MTQKSSKRLISSSISSKSEITSAKPAKYILLEPAGYPIRIQISNEERLDANQVTTDNPKLFSKYGCSQWEGLIVKQGDYLFDSMIIPDFAFRIVSLKPKEQVVEITDNTNIELKTQKKPKKPKLVTRDVVKFDDIIGQQQAKQKAKVILHFLQNPSLLNSEWSPRNILFSGVPGTGKTMMARALAYHAKAPFIPIKANELIGIFVGEGSKKVQSLFKEARKISPCIIFIDELDAIALKRNYQQIRGDVIEIVSALLGEMDGISEEVGNNNVITIAASNLVEEIDPAIMNRFEEIIEFTLPNQEERENILLNKAINRSPVPFDVNWQKISMMTKGYSGRKLVHQLLKTAIHDAIIKKIDVITTSMIEKIIKKNHIENQNLKYYA